MEEKIIEIIGFMMEPELAELKAKEIIALFADYYPAEFKTMEEKIKKIFKEYGLDPISLCLCIKEISDLFKDYYPAGFIEWSILHKDLYIKIGTLPGLFQYWQDNIKEK